MASNGNGLPTEDDFINHEIRHWGFDYIEKLLNDGYQPVLTEKGWTWAFEPVPIINPTRHPDPVRALVLA